MQNVKLDKKAIISLIIYGVCLIEILLIIPVQIGKFSSLHHKISILKKKVTETERDLSSKDKFVKDKEKLRLDIINLESSLATSQDISAVLAFISRKAKENAVDILEITQSRPKLYKNIEGVKIYTLPITAKAKAGFHNLAQCFDSLQGGVYFLGVDKFSVKGNSPYNQVEFTVTALFRE